MLMEVMVVDDYRLLWSSTIVHLALGPPLKKQGQGSPGLPTGGSGLQGWGASSFPVSIQPQARLSKFLTFFLGYQRKGNKTNCLALQPRQPTIFSSKRPSIA